MVPYNETFIIKFKELFSKPEYQLPKRWNGGDFYLELFSFLKKYQGDVENIFDEFKVNLFTPEIEKKCQCLYTAVDCYFRGNTKTAYDKVSELMEELNSNGLLLEDVDDVMKKGNGEDREYLFRVSDVGNSASCDRKRIFHVPFNLRTKMSTNRYSMPGYPSLYFGTSLELCCKEIHRNPKKKTLIAARFELDTSTGMTKGKEKENQYYDYEKPEIIDLSLRPEDLLEKTKINLKNNFQSFPNYLHLYPLIAACSFMRAKKKDPFSPEYIIPQLVTQWLCLQCETHTYGIKYFPCVSKKASRLGYNYVFPSSGIPNKLFENNIDYCERLARRFTLTKPVYLCDSDTLDDCQKKLKDDELDYIEGFKTKREIINEPLYETPFGVSDIPAFSFQGNTAIKDVKIKDGVTRIGDFAFHGCSSLENVTMQKSLMKIGRFAFGRCSKLKSIEIPANVTEIGPCAFFSCEGLEEVSFPFSVYFKISKIEYSSFAGCSSLKKISLPDSVTEIGEAAFEGCTALTKIYIPDSVKKIGESAFLGCESLEEITIPDSVTEIGDHAFWECDNLKTINCSDRVRKLYDDSFDLDKDTWNLCDDDDENDDITD